MQGKLIMMSVVKRYRRHLLGGPQRHPSSTIGAAQPAGSGINRRGMGVVAPILASALFVASLGLVSLSLTNGTNARLPYQR